MLQGLPMSAHWKPNRSLSSCGRCLRKTGNAFLHEGREADIRCVAAFFPRGNKADLGQVKRWCCQTTANQSHFSSNLNSLGRAEAAPLGKSGGTVQLEIRSTVKVALRVEVVVDCGVDIADHLHRRAVGTELIGDEVLALLASNAFALTLALNLIELPVDP